MEVLQKSSTPRFFEMHCIYLTTSQLRTNQPCEGHSTYNHRSRIRYLSKKNSRI